MAGLLSRFGFGSDHGPVGRRVRRMKKNDDEAELIQRYRPENDPELREDWNEDLPFGGKVSFAKRQKPDSWPCIAVQVLAIVLAISLGAYAWWYFDHLHFTVARFYAHLGYPHAQHVVGQKYLHGHGVERHPGKAMQWFRKAADQGHPHAAYNLAVGYLQGVHSDVEPGEAHQLVQHAAREGVPEAFDTLNDICANGGCD